MSDQQNESLTTEDYRRLVQSSMEEAERALGAGDYVNANWHANMAETWFESWAIRIAENMPGVPDHAVSLQVCKSCNNEIDPDVCGCGGTKSGHINPMHDGHSFVPVGCDCYRVKYSTL